MEGGERGERKKRMVERWKKVPWFILEPEDSTHLGRR